MHSGKLRSGVRPLHRKPAIRRQGGVNTANQVSISIAADGDKLKLVGMRIFRGGDGISVHSKVMNDLDIVGGISVRDINGAGFAVTILAVEGQVTVSVPTRRASPPC